ncbi:hypothetical protein [Rhodovulum euryhalinum]|uniref:Uncharacterized protein n=1 Tax=Rhodovulum euryhalinum TaxID=35805 RepID=A0A4R2KJZ8_9RHOB|nr:hypothetical protein [Rhodovulum euryhalinum]TCO70926.1 hypothetical protein EV655_108167 [Rhodovulum euryhalinum]
MTADRDIPGERPTLRREVARAEVTETGWGYVVAADGAFHRKAVVIERGAWAGAFACFALAGVHWLVPPLYPVLGLGGQLAVSGALAFAGLGLSWLADRGLLEEVHVDLEVRALRCMRSNARGVLRILREVGFDEIGSVFVLRAEGAGRAARLFVRVGTGNDLIEVTRGREVALGVLQQRMASDFHGSSLRKTSPGRRGKRGRGLARPLSHAA